MHRRQTILSAPLLLLAIAMQKYHSNKSASKSATTITLSQRAFAKKMHWTIFVIEMKQNQHWKKKEK